MTVQQGAALLLKIRMDDASYRTVAGMRSQEIAFNADPVDMTHAESAGRWRELLAASGVRSVQIEGQGIFTDAASDARFRSLFFDGGHPDCRIVLPDFGTLSGLFAITGLSYLGSYEGELAWQIELQSAGEIRFAAL